ncbi:hypothetical protein ACHAXS_012218 [Conticribra weissflogii]
MNNGNASTFHRFHRHPNHHHLPPSSSSSSFRRPIRRSVFPTTVALLLLSSPPPPPVFAVPTTTTIQPQPQPSPANDPHRDSPFSSSSISTDPIDDRYCGENWMDAYRNCRRPCPSGLDAECQNGDVAWTCHFYTGCGGGDGASSDHADDEEIEGDDNATAATATTTMAPIPPNFCGKNWMDAASSCSRPCPSGPSDCDEGQDCFVASDCVRPTVRWSSDLILTLLGGEEEKEQDDDDDGDGRGGSGLGKMNGDESGVLEESILDVLAAALNGHAGEEGIDGVSAMGAGVTGQTTVEGRRRWMREKEDDDEFIDIDHRTNRSSSTIVEVETNTPRRQLPTASSALDVSMTITGEYRPPPYLDLDHLVTSSINRASSTVIADLRQRASRVGSTYFERVRDLKATSADDVTTRPTPRPSGTPTRHPTSIPTATPTVSPTRARVQSLTTAKNRDGNDDPEKWWEGTSRSYGILFRVRTTSDADAVRILGMDIYAASSSPDEELHYEIWTKEGTWEGYEGNAAAFEKIAEGNVVSKGECSNESAANGTTTTCEFTRLPWEEFAPVSLAGGGGSRSFYVTLPSGRLVYGRRGAENEASGAAAAAVMERYSTPELEIYEGAGVLRYPLEEATDRTLDYRSPRSFLGRIYYDRMPCEGDVENEDGNGYYYDFGPCEAHSTQGVGAGEDEKDTEDVIEEGEMAPVVPTTVPTVGVVGGDEKWNDVIDADEVGNTTENDNDDVDANPQTDETLLAVPSEQLDDDNENDGAQTPSLEESHQSPFAGNGDDDFSDKKEIESNAGDETGQNALIAPDQEVEDTPHNVMNEHEHDNEVEYDNDTWENINMIETGNDNDAADGENSNTNASITSPATINDYNTYDPDGLLQTIFILTLQNVPDIVMNDREIVKYQQVLLNYLLKQSTLSAVMVDVLSVEVWHQELPHLKEIAKVKDTVVSSTSKKYRTKARKLQNVIDSISYSSSAFQNLSKDPSLINVEITTIVRSSNTKLPPDVASILILNVIASANSTFVDDLRNQQAFYSYFKNIDGVTVNLIEEATLPPTVAPTTYEQFLSRQAAENGPEGRRPARRFNIVVATGLGIAALWCLLTLCSLSYLRNARNKMKNDKMLNSLRSSKREIAERNYAFFRTAHRSRSDDWEGGEDGKLKSDFAPSEMAKQNSLVSRVTYRVDDTLEDRHNCDIESGALDFDDNFEDSDSDSDSTDGDGDRGSTDSDSSGDDDEREEDCGVFIPDRIDKGRSKVSILLDKKLGEKLGKIVQKKNPFDSNTSKVSLRTKSGQAGRKNRSFNSSLKSSATRFGFLVDKMSSRNLGQISGNAKLGMNVEGDVEKIMALKGGNDERTMSSRRKLGSVNEDDAILRKVTCRDECPLFAIPRSRESTEDEINRRQNSLALPKAKSHGVLLPSDGKDYPRESKQTRRKSDDLCPESAVAFSKLAECRKTHEVHDSNRTSYQKNRRKISCESRGGSAIASSSTTNGDDAIGMHNRKAVTIKPYETTSDSKYRRKSSSNNAKDNETSMSTKSTSRILRGAIVSSQSPNPVNDSQYRRKSSSENVGEASYSAARGSDLRTDQRGGSASHPPDSVIHSKHCRRSSFDSIGGVSGYLLDSDTTPKQRRRNSSGNFQVGSDPRSAKSTAVPSHSYNVIDPNHRRRSSFNMTEVSNEIDSLLAALADPGPRNKESRTAAASTYSPDFATYAKHWRRSSPRNFIVNGEKYPTLGGSRHRRSGSSEHVNINKDEDVTPEAFPDPQKNSSRDAVRDHRTTNSPQSRSYHVKRDSENTNHKYRYQSQQLHFRESNAPTTKKWTRRKSVDSESVASSLCHSADWSEIKRTKRRSSQ